MNQIEFYQSKLEFETDAWDVKEAMEKGENMVLIDARSESSYVHEHIEGAISLPYREMSKQSLANLDNEATYIVYCAGHGCNASTKGALILAQNGFKSKELIGGLQWWKHNAYPTNGALADVSVKQTCDC